MTQLIKKTEQQEREGSPCRSLQSGVRWQPQADHAPLTPSPHTHTQREEFGVGRPYNNTKLLTNHMEGTARKGTVTKTFFTLSTASELCPENAVKAQDAKLFATLVKVNSDQQTGTSCT